MPNKTVDAIVQDYLESNGFGGLFNTDEPCGCELNELFGCGHELGEILECEAGYKVPCHAECDAEQCDSKPGTPDMWCIRRERPAPKVKVPGEAV